MKYPIPANSAAAGINMLPKPFESGIFWLWWPNICAADKQWYKQPQTMILERVLDKSILYKTVIYKFTASF